jgi:hypothetical protein
MSGFAVYANGAARLPAESDFQTLGLSAGALF